MKIILRNIFYRWVTRNGRDEQMIDTEFSNNQNERTTSKFSILALGILCTRYNFFHIKIGIFLALL